MGEPLEASSFRDMQDSLIQEDDITIDTPGPARLSQSADRYAMSDIGPGHCKKGGATKKRSRADLTKAIEYLGINTSEVSRFTLISGGGNAAEQQELHRARKGENRATDASEGKEEKKPRHKENVKRRMVYWLDPGIEVYFCDVTDGSKSSYIKLQKSSEISIS